MPVACRAGPVKPQCLGLAPDKPFRDSEVAVGVVSMTHASPMARFAPSGLPPSRRDSIWPLARQLPAVVVPRGRRPTLQMIVENAQAQANQCSGRGVSFRMS